MSDKSWGFEKNYAHKVVPHAWNQTSNFRFYQPDPFRKKSFRPYDMPVYRDDLIPLNTQYTERSQDAQNCMSPYGTHREQSWDSSLRSPRNPFPGRQGRETRYLKERSPLSTKDGPWHLQPAPHSARAASYSGRRRSSASAADGDSLPATPDTGSGSARWRTQPRILPLPVT